MRAFDDALVRKLVANPTAVAEFPFLAARVLVQPRAACCGRKKATAPRHAPDYARIRAGVAGLPPDRQRRLLALAGLAAARLVYRDGKRIVDVRLG